jgi:hypothetical protein
VESGGTDHRLYVHVNRPHVWFGPEVYAVNFTHRVYKPRGRVFPGSAQRSVGRHRRSTVQGVSCFSFKLSTAMWYEDTSHESFCTTETPRRHPPDPPGTHQGRVSANLAYPDLAFNSQCNDHVLLKRPPANNLRLRSEPLKILAIGTPPRNRLSMK